jgi:hypothetical protein
MTDHKTGSPNVTAAGGGSFLITFDTAQTDARLGIGDEVSIAAGAWRLFLKRKISYTQWEATGAMGFAPPLINISRLTGYAARLAH